MFSTCLAQAIFPQRWKTGSLVLFLRKGCPVESPSAYRLIVLLDDIGKLFKRIVANRIVKHLEYEGPNLAESQFRFRKGRSTIHAVWRVRSLMQEAVSQGEVIMAVFLDISMPLVPCLGLSKRRLCVSIECHSTCAKPLGLTCHTAMYRDGQRYIDVYCGAPQELVLGPLLWNIGYDWVLRGAYLKRRSLVTPMTPLLPPAAQISVRLLYSSQREWLKQWRAFGV